MADDGSPDAPAPDPSHETVGAVATDSARRTDDQPAAPTGVRSRMVRLAVGWLPDGTPVRRMLTVSFIDSLGTGMFLTGSALFFTRDIGLTAAQVGLGLSLAAVAGFLCSVPVGRLSDRFGALPLLVALQFWRAAWFFAYPFVADLPWFLVVCCLAGAGEWAAGPVVQSLLGSLVAPAARVRAMAAVMLVRNIGFVLGATSATIVIALGGGNIYRVLVLLDAVSFLVSGALLLRLRGRLAVARPPATAPEPEQAERRTRPSLRFLTLVFLNGVLYLHAVILSVGLPLWITTRTDAPVELVGAVVVLNTVLAISLQMRLSRGVDGLRPAASRQRRAGFILAACCALVSLTGPAAPAVAAALILAGTAALTVGEIYQSVGAWGVSYGYAPDASRGYHLSLYSLGSTGAMIVGPALLTSVVMPAGLFGWLGLAAVLAAAGALVPVVVRFRRLPAAETTQPV
ncbi:MFS transporter [Micromonospora narathiwatensis]|uniref:Predicted arabinose efflux permease, MFS family n=1 Tax=Micromonospora narathiwatensis TaxID=299146 RepID=A0A1A8ZB66_9ACTN|nr:MFS transporter [Micromonospora narathiwatensis]SBT41111.1 Predicted arabinose efflux permease, MFS family [Micromonospora narathiwatensis]